MADRSAKMAYGAKSQISSRIQNGTIDERDIVFTSDTSEIVYIKDDLTQQIMKSRIELFDSVDSAVNTLNHQSSSYEGQPIGIRNQQGNYELYTTWNHGGTLSVKRLTYATETEAIEQKADAHIADEIHHITANERAAWNSKTDSATYNAHVENSDIHTSASEHLATQTHIANNVIHTTAAERQEYQEHIANADIHVTANEHAAYSNHIQNEDFHVTAADKARWNTQSTTFNTKDDFIADLSNHNVGDVIHVVFPAQAINDVTNGKITSPVFGLLCRTGQSRYDMTLSADGYLMYMVRLDNLGNINRVSRATLSTV